MNKREQQKQHRREQIILAAKELFLKQGIQQVQLQDVANVVGIGIATLFRYFPNKEQLLIAVNTEITQQFTKKTIEISNKDISSYEKIEQILNYYINLANVPEHKFVHFIKAMENYKPVDATSYEFTEYIKCRREMADVLIRIAENGRRDQSIRTDIDLEFYILTIVQNISYFTTESTLTNHDPSLKVKLDPQVQLHMLKDIFLNHLKDMN